MRHWIRSPQKKTDVALIYMSMIKDVQVFIQSFPSRYSISQEICTRFLLCCALLWLYIDWFSHIHQLTLLALWQSNDCPSASKATLMNMDKYFMWIHYERLHNHNKAKHNKTVCIFLGIYCSTAEPKLPTTYFVTLESSEWNSTKLCKE